MKPMDSYSSDSSGNEWASGSESEGKSDSDSGMFHWPSLRSIGPIHNALVFLPSKTFSTEVLTYFSETKRKMFAERRKAHYNEFEMVRQAREKGKRPAVSFGNDNDCDNENDDGEETTTTSTTTTTTSTTPEEDNKNTTTTQDVDMKERDPDD